MRYGPMRKAAFSIILVALVTGCATPAYVSPVQVTRFVGETPATLAQGTVQITAARGLDSEALEFGIYADALRQELETLGYTVVAEDGGQMAMISIRAFVAEGEGRGRGVGVGAGGSTGSYGSGVGVGVGIDLTSLINGPPPERIERELFIALQPADGGTNLWEGRASMTATGNSDYANETAAAARMVSALFEDFPGNSGETIEVE